MSVHDIHIELTDGHLKHAKRDSSLGQPFGRSPSQRSNEHNRSVGCGDPVHHHSDRKHDLVYASEFPSTF